MQELSKKNGITVSLNDSGDVVISGKVQKKCSTRLTKDSPQWEMLVEIVFDATLLNLILEGVVSKDVIAVQSALRQAQSQDVIDAYLQNLPNKKGIPVYSTTHETAGSSPFAKDGVSALAAKVAKLSDEEKAAVLKALGL